MGKGSRVTQLHKTESSAIRDDLTMQLEAAKKAQAEKLAQSESHLVGQLMIASEKYLTVNGFMQARTTLEQVCFGSTPDNADTLSAELAGEMSELADELAEKLRNTDVTKLDETFLDGLLIKDFVTRTEFSPSDVVAQLLRVNLLQNIGPSIDDIVSFRVSTDEAIATLRAGLVAQSGVTEGQTTLDGSN